MKNIEIEDFIEYKAVYKECPTENLKDFPCILAISVGQPSHEGKKFEAILKLISHTFKECIVMVCDSLQRHTIAIHQPYIVGKELYSKAIKEGDDWINRNLSKLDNLLTIPYKILRWDEWLSSTQYTLFRERIDNMYTAKIDNYKNVLNESARQFVDRIKQTSEVTNYGKAVELSLEYLKEESAVTSIWHKLGYKFIVYQGMNKAIKYTTKIFSLDRFYLSYKFKVLEEETLSLQGILDVSPAHIYWKDTNGIYIGGNKAQFEYCGFKNIYELKGKKDLDFLEKNIAKKVRQNDLSVIKKGKASVKKETDSNGTVFLSHKAPLKNCKGEIVGVIGNSIDITRQESAELRLKRSIQDLAVALEAKERFLRNMSHEIRTPLQTILGIPSGLMDNYDNLSDEQIKYYLRGMIEQSDRLMNLVSNLMDLSKFREGKFTMEFRKENLREIYEEIINEFKYVHPHITLNIISDVTPEAMCDKFRVGQVLRNLIGNSIKHGGKDKEIRITVDKHSKQKSYIKTTVEDQGVGIPEGEEKIIFEPFIESSQTRSEGGGTGLGLSIVKEIIESHKGKVWVESKTPNMHGACVSFILPS